MTSAAAFFWSTCGAVMAVLCIALIVYWLPRRKVNRRVSRNAWCSRHAHPSFWAGETRGRTECR